VGKIFCVYKIGYHLAMFRRRKLRITLFALAIFMVVVPPALAGASAVVFMYHRFGENSHPSTNITIEQFEAHLKELESGTYNVLSLSDITDALRRGAPLPERTVGISVDDAYLSVYTMAWPRLKEAGFPFTLFTSTRAIDQGLKSYMNWRQIREMADAGVTIGHHMASHGHMLAAEAGSNRRELAEATQRFSEKLENKPALFAYPYGEASQAVRKMIIDAGFSAAFGQHSGVIGGDGDLYFLPRFAMSEKYGALSRFRLAANALPLTVTEVTPPDFLVTGNNPPAIGFTVTGGIEGLERLNCFSSHEGKLRVIRLADTRIEVRLRSPLPEGQTRLNCTQPAADGRWRWLGRQFYFLAR
jgi:peptidoglycan/xylan/chitin deacetylase (PgdA/CDA1 family)